MTIVKAPNNQQGSALEPPRFSLRTLLLAMTALCGLFGLMVTIGLLWSAAVVIVLSLVGAHVLGNSLGTALRDRATGRIASERSPVHLLLQAAANDVAVPGRLTKHARLSRVTTVMTLGGASVGALLGGMASAGLYPEAPDTAVALGVISFSVLGGFAGFATSSFLSVARAAIRESLAASEPARPRAHEQHD